jgi:hypothetical protein
VIYIRLKGNSACVDGFFLYRLHQRKRYRRPAEEPEEDKYVISCTTEKNFKILTFFFLHFRRENRHFVRVPQAVAADYDVAPQSTIRTDKNRNSRVSLFVCNEC